MFYIVNKYKICFVKDIPNFKTVGRVCTGILKRFVKNFNNENIVVVFVDEGCDKVFDLLKKIATTFECDIIETRYSDYKNVITVKPTKIKNQSLTDYQIVYRPDMIVSTHDIDKPCVDFAELTENDVVFVTSNRRKNVFSNYSIESLQKLFNDLKKNVVMTKI